MSVFAARPGGVLVAKHQLKAACLRARASVCRPGGAETVTKTSPLPSDRSCAVVTGCSRPGEEGAVMGTAVCVAVSQQPGGGLVCEAALAGL